MGGKKENKKTGAKRKLNQEQGPSSLGGAGLVLGEEGVAVPRDLHVHVPVEVDPHGPIAGFEAGKRRRGRGGGLLDTLAQQSFRRFLGLARGPPGLLERRVDLTSRPRVPLQNNS